MISVPAYFDDKRRKATKRAGELAGLKVERMISEPTAAAVAYGLYEKEKDTRFLVFDLGGGTFDVSILELYHNILEVRAVAGDNYLGGEDFTEVMSKLFMQKTCGVARALKKHNPDVYIVAVEPESSPVLEGGVAGSHRIQGIGANFVPAIYDASVVDEVLPVPDDEAIRGGRDLASTEGLLAGISSGAAVYAARLLAQRPDFADKKIVVLLPDTGERYLSTELFAFETYPLD